MVRLFSCRAVTLVHTRNCAAVMAAAGVFPGGLGGDGKHVTTAPFLVDSQLRVVVDESDDGNAFLIHTLLLRE